jgi:hypothetical protein
MEILIAAAALIVLNVLVHLGFGTDSRDNQNWDPAGKR